MKIRQFFTLVLFLGLSVPAAGYQEVPPKLEDPAAKEKAEKRKRLQEINRLQDEAQKRELLEKFIEENPQGPHLDEAYNSLLATLLKADAGQAVALTDQLLARPQNSENPWLHKTAYHYRFRAFQKQKDEEAIQALAQHVLETQTAPDLLHEVAGSDKERALVLYEKALAEKKKNPTDDSFPHVGHLYSDYAGALKKAGRKDEALAQMSEGVQFTADQVAKISALPENDPQRRPLDMWRWELIELHRSLARLQADMGLHEKAAETMGKVVERAEKDLAELEALPDQDPLRQRLRFLKETLPSQYSSFAEMLVDAGQAEKGLEALEKADRLLANAVPDSRRTFEQTRARLYEKMGNAEKAMEGYVRAFAFGMDPKVREKIKTLADQVGKPEQEFLAQAREIRENHAQNFKPFELKTVEGETKTFQDFQNKVTLVNFFFPT